uniref:Uncharacterized protein n=1 Tax=Tanacetum cinerariifolium TaxID=118510 RepID=A0A699LAF0_TANCI|nr:hypothetical protein [Tanacetum cinerariifolium]
MKLFLNYEEKDGEKIVKKELLVALKGETYFVKFIINPGEDDVEPGVILGRSFLRLARGIVDFGNEVITIYTDLDPFGDDSDNSNDSGDDWEAILEGVDFGDLSQLDVMDVPPYVCNTRKSSRNNVMLDKLKLDEEVENNEEEATEEVIKGYKTLREKNDQGVFVLPIYIEAKFDSFTLADTGLNINAKPMGILKDVLCQVRVTTILAKFLILDIPLDKDVPIVVGRSFLYTCGGIINTIKWTTSTFDGVCHQKFYVAAVRNKHKESDDDEVEYIRKIDKNGKPIYGLKFEKYLNCDDPIDGAITLQEAMNLFRKICEWKKLVAFIGSLCVPLQQMKWILNYFDNFIKCHTPT